MFWKPPSTVDQLPVAPLFCPPLTVGHVPAALLPLPSSITGQLGAMSAWTPWTDPPAMTMTTSKLMTTETRAYIGILLHQAETEERGRSRGLCGVGKGTTRLR